MIGHFDAFDDSVWRLGHNLVHRRYVLECLVVQAVDRQAICAQRRTQL
jgi:hypothetical protein